MRAVVLFPAATLPAIPITEAVRVVFVRGTISGFGLNDALPLDAQRDAAPGLARDRAQQRDRGRIADDVRPGDYLEFGAIGAYSLAGRTSFNGHFSDEVVVVTDAASYPPG